MLRFTKSDLLNVVLTVLVAGAVAGLVSSIVSDCPERRNPFAGAEDF